jgi:DNA-binding response OmpR family regulator
MATVLILATDPMIGGLVGQLADLAGHATLFRRDGEDLRNAVRESCADVVMLDAAYGLAATNAVTAAAGDAGASLVYFASTLTATELRRLALERGAKYFALPAGPKLLARVLADALDRRSAPTALDLAATCASAVAAAAAAVTRARALAADAESVRAESRALRADRELALAACRQSRARLREAVIAYTRELRGAGVPPERTLEMVKSALRSDGAGVPHPRPDLDPELDDAVEWCLQAYYAA